MNDHSGQTYLITGSTGIAAATAQLAGQAGAQIFFVSHDSASCEALAAELTRKSVNCGFAVADLTIPAQVSRAVAACQTQFERIDGLFNVVGISGRRYGDGPLHECTLEGWEKTLDVNLKTAFLMCRAVLNVMLAQPLDPHGLRGALLNMGSILSLSPEPKHFATHAYAASKAALVGLSQSLAAYYAPQKIRVNVIAPSLVKTPMSQRAQQDEQILEYMRHKHPLGEEMLAAEEVARAALFLLGPDARRITGEVLKVDAGWSVSNC